MHDESLLLYARAYDLVEDHTSISPLSFICLPFDTDEEALDPTILFDDLRRFLPCLGNSVQTSKQPLEVTKDVTNLLSKVIAIRNYREGVEEPYLKWASLRVDEPLLTNLATESTLDKPSFPEVDLKQLKLPEEETNDDRDEGLQFPTYTWDRKNEIMQDIAADKMTVDRSVLEYLRSTVKAHVVEGVSEDYLEPIDDAHNMQQVDLDPLTPPLLPLIEPDVHLSPITLEEIAGSLETIDINEDAVASFGTQVEPLQREELQLTPKTDRLLDRIQRAPSITPSPVQPLPKELYIETPITPPITSPSRTIFSRLDTENRTDETPYAQSFNFGSPNQPVDTQLSNLFEEFIVPPSLDPSEDGDGMVTPSKYNFLTESAMAEFTLGVMEPGAQYFMMKLQQEQLEDSTKPDDGSGDGLRVDIPIVNWQRLVPLWVSNRFLIDILEDEMDEDIMQRWDYRKSLDISGLQWNIGKPKKVLQETIVPDERETEELIASLFPEVPLETVIEEEDEAFWRRHDTSNEYEELECAKIEPKTDLDSLVERQKLRGINVIKSANKRPRSIFDSESDLSAFLSLQSRDLELATNAISATQQAPSTISSPTSSHRVSSITKVSTIEQDQERISIQPPDPTSVFMISASFLENRILYRKIRSLCPGCKFIERDFDTVTSANTFSPKDQVPDEPVSEADILVSPLVGMIFTNLQTIRHRKLQMKSSINSTALLSAAESANDGIRDRIMKVAERYDRLLVCVTLDFGGTDADDLILARADCVTISGFIGFCEAIGNVEVTVIQSGNSNDKIGRWILENLRIHSERWRMVGLVVEISDIGSSWENFLRHAGMNSYAAQAF
ncbi:hypothetical protein H072_2635 [Dactylellina haptotyla CBS 200.50]|uniref:DUF7102 domain-containing protein n=1 Tax=Dactylellina haptotyla (strain CBS 200.50) TaxID=1284197 RepID=S8C6M4_DACHA|nr:hypothetical protein H072_2635 [Dactylellina haptotyla CBS 200.50]